MKASNCVPSSGAGPRWLVAVAALLALDGCCLQPAEEGYLPDSGLLDAGSAGSCAVGNPCLMVGRGTFDYGLVAINAMESGPGLEVTNTCDSEMTLTIAPLGGADIQVFSTNPGANGVIKLQGHDTAFIVVTYAPLVVSPKANTALMSFSACSNGACCTVDTPLRGTPVPTCVVLQPSPLDFGPTPVGTTATKMVTLQDICSSASVHLAGDPVVLTSAASGGMNPNGAFQPGSGYPMKYSWIESGNSLQLPVAFTPSTAGSFSGELDIATDDIDQPNTRVLLTGTGQ